IFGSISDVGWRSHQPYATIISCVNLPHWKSCKKAVSFSRIFRLTVSVIEVFGLINSIFFGEYDRVARTHTRSTVMGGAHSGPAFLPWHREYIKRFEFAIRQIDPTLALPYWDSTLEEALALISATSFFPFTFTIGRPNIKREVGAKGGPMKQSEIDFVMKQSEVDQVLAFSAPRRGCPYRTDYNCLEYTHGNVHIFVGGDMFDTSTSANDPLFFLHHAFIDLIWEQWRQQRQTRAERERVYPPDNQLCASPQHFAAAQMNPFPPMRNIDGLSNKYTDNLYEYAPRPTCTEAYPDCGSKYLFCDQSHGQARCAAKIRLEAACDGYVRGENPCFNGACVAGRCTATVIFSFKETCFNENECCALWAERGECTVNAPYMSVWCKASCGQCRPRYPLIDDCSDRHHNCERWARSGECTINSLWMSENCRRSCGRCHQSRSQACREHCGEPTTTLKPKEVCGSTNECYNENICCPHWSLQSECTKQQSWMACNCRVSCGHCIPQNYSYGSCHDYHLECQGWARLGECERNPWMLENCRFSCQSCFSHWDLREMCGEPAGKISALRSYGINSH
uniref:ShTK domain protein n=1 Tax=Angiostrongylus cantonensis TaxID=6313 RepID=A0A158P622_ANGCA